MRNVTLISIIGIGVITTACTPIQHRPTRGETIDTVSTTVDIDNELTTAAFSVQQSLRTLAASKEPHELNAINTEPLITPQGGMGHRATLDWSGPIEPLLHRVAHMSRYNVKILGPSPAVPVVVTLMAENRKIADILKDAGLQAGKRANLVVYPSSRIIELRYIPT
jgi:defect in organelle trafficking protein DotD